MGHKDCHHTIVDLAGENAKLKEQLEDVRQVVDAAREANHVLAKRGEFGWADAFGLLNKALCAYKGE